MLGVLSAVKVDFEASVSGSAAYENLSPSGGEVLLELTARVQLTLPDASVLGIDPAVMKSEEADPFDGLDDKDGPSGSTFDLLSGSAMLTAAPTDLALFTGPGTIALPVNARGRSNGSGPGTLALLFATSAGAKVTVTYTYFKTGVDIEKLTNGADADTAPGPFVPVGGAVAWKYVVKNTGELPLASVVVGDDHVGVVVTCPKTTLDPGESMECTANGVATAGQYKNVGSVSAQPTNGGQPVGGTVTDTDPSHYFGYVGAIDVEKSTNGEDADLPPGPTIPVGQPVKWVYKVTNTGTVFLTGIVVSDDKGVLVTCPPQQPLAPGESIECTGQGVAVEGQYKNTGKATGQPVDGGGLPLGGTVTDTDPSHYLGAVVCVPIPFPKATEYIRYKGVVYYVLHKFDKRFVVIDGERHYLRVRKDGKRVITIDGVDYPVLKRNLSRRLARGLCPPAPVKPDDKPKDDLPVSQSPPAAGEESATAGGSATATGKQESAGQPQGPGAVTSGTSGGQAGTKVTCVGSARYWFDGPGKTSKAWARIGRKGGQTRFFSSKRTYRQVLAVVPDRPYLVLARAYVTARLNALGGAPLPAGAAESVAWAEQYFREAGEVEYPRKDVLQHARTLRKHDLPFCSS